MRSILHSRWALCCSVLCLFFIGFNIITAFKPTTYTAVKFAEASWENSKAKAMQEGKLYFVDFDASYCATCRNMDASTYMDDRLAQYMQEKVVALRVDVQDFDGVMWSQQYEVEALPTMLIFDADGNLVKRLVGYKSAKDLISEFEGVPLPTKTSTAAAPATTTPQPIAPDQPMVRPTPSTPAPPSPVNTAPTASAPTKQAPEVPQPSGMGLYEVEVRKQASQGFGVQVGVYSSYETVLAQASKFKSKYTKRTLIHIDQYNGSVVYKLLLGTFNSRREASYFRNSLRNDNVDGLLKDLSLLK